MIEEIVSSLVVAALAAAIGSLYTQGYLAEWRDRAATRLRRTPPGGDLARQSISRFGRSLVRRLIRDQSRRGVHFGQFGRSTALAEGRKYQLYAEDLSTKPRLYLTFWPGVILRKRRCAAHAVHLANQGIQRLFEDGSIHVHQPIIAGSPIRGSSRLISYRHTLCGALYLHRQLGWNETTASVVDAMLDRRNRWQNSDGGWAHSDREVVCSDLWGSAYALRLLDAIQTEDSAVLTAGQRTLASQALEQTSQYLARAWTADAWRYANATSEDNAVLLFLEIADVLPRHAPQLFEEVRRQLQEWLSPKGDLSKTYVSACPEVLPARLRARMAYALFRAGEAREVWAPLFDEAARGDDHGFVSVEMAFMLDLTFERAGSAPSAGSL